MSSMRPRQAADYKAKGPLRADLAEKHRLGKKWPDKKSVPIFFGTLGLTGH